MRSSPAAGFATTAWEMTAGKSPTALCWCVHIKTARHGADCSSSLPAHICVLDVSLTASFYPMLLCTALQDADNAPECGITDLDKVVASVSRRVPGVEAPGLLSAGCVLDKAVASVSSEGLSGVELRRVACSPEHDAEWRNGPATECVDSVARHSTRQACGLICAASACRRATPPPKKTISNPTPPITEQIEDWAYWGRWGRCGVRAYTVSKMCKGDGDSESPVPARS